MPTLAGLVRAALCAALIGAAACDSQEPTAKGTANPGSGGAGLAPANVGASGGSGAAIAGQSGTGGAPHAGGSGSGGAAPSQPVADAAVAQDASAIADAAMPALSAPLADTQALIPDPSWDCAMPQGLPPLAGATLVFEAVLQIGEVMAVGATQYGERTVFGVSGGTFTGPKIEGEVLDGALDWQLTRPNHAVEIEGVAILRTDDGASIYMRNCGVAPGDGDDVRIAPDFEASSNGAYAWLNTGKFVGKRVLDMAQKTLTLSVYEAQAIAAGADVVSMPMKDPALPSQAWQCEEPPGAAGTLVYTEQVAIGGGVGIGASKYGSRNIIPITGGTFSGEKLDGDVIPGGADFQLTATGSASLELDARYTLRTDDGELIVVRNCGSASATKLYFEALVTGKYAWLNGAEFTSSVGLALGGVMISIYDVE